MRDVGTWVAVLYLGRSAELASRPALFSALRHPYTRMLLSAIPVVSEEEERLKPRWIVPRGETPSPARVPPGCSFHPRCHAAFDVCPRLDPVAAAVDGDPRVRWHLYSGCRPSEGTHEAAARRRLVSAYTVRGK